MNLKQFKYVLILADEHNFSAAAEVLNITRPSLSHYIKKIEKKVGQMLFDSTNGDVRLTDAGRAYIGGLAGRCSIWSVNWKNICLTSSPIKSEQSRLVFQRIALLLL